MSVQRISFNINGGNPPPNRDTIYDFVRNKYKPTAALVMDNRDAAVNLASNGATLVTHRSYSDIEHELWLRESPQQFCDRELAWGNPQVYRHALNEPAIGDARLITWLTEVGYRHVDNGYGIVLGNFAVGSYEKQHIESGYFDELLRLVCQPNNRVWLGVHEYTSILLPFGASMWSLEQLYDKAECQPANWPERADLQVTRLPNGDLPNRWHFLRSCWFTIRAQELGLGVPKFWVTESGWDALPDLGAQGVLDHFKNTYGIPAPYESLRGVNTLRPIFADYFPYWSFERAAFEQLKWLASIYPDNYIGHCLFTVTNSPDWKIGAGTDYSELYELHNLLLEAKGQDVPEIQWKEVTLQPKGTFANVRSTPNTLNDSNIVGRIEGVTKVMEATSNSVNWRYVKLPNGVVGYVSSGVVLDYNPTVPEREYQITLKQSEVDALKRISGKLP